ncbi:MAG: phenylalanine--tRNA ligase subunit alpha [Ignavibacteriae bacterium]|nr:MAG: phenylalanine--tRNA ligase subunit alpha [Ignavibacteriota bacterium]
MLSQIEAVRIEIENDLAAVDSSAAVEAFRLKHLVKKGTLQGLIDQLRAVPKEEKPAIGKALNVLRSFVDSEFERLRTTYAQTSTVTPIDLSLPARGTQAGSVHPITQTLDRIVDIFSSMGFDVAEGPDVEDDARNFSKLNFAEDHPARDMQDTFFVNAADRNDLLLRTHTSSVQVRVMESTKPPIRCIMPGRVYRNEAVSARSLAEFHQVEGLYIDKGVTMADLKGTIMAFARRFYDENAKFRFRTSYFPFTEPSAEVDMSCFLCHGEGCRVCKHTGWLEIAGCGMVHPNVLTACGIDPEEYSGFAFGFGVERVVMMLTGIDDIRLLYENDLRVLKQF